MNTLIDHVAEHIGLFAAGSSLLLGTAALAMWCCGSPAHRLRLGGLSLASVLVWLPFALIPWPRPVLWEARPSIDHAAHLPSTPARRLTPGAVESAAQPNSAGTSEPAASMPLADRRSVAAEATVQTRPEHVAHVRQSPGSMRILAERPIASEVPAAGEEVSPPKYNSPAVRPSAAPGPVPPRDEPRMQSARAQKGPQRWLATAVCGAAAASVAWLVAAHAALALVGLRSEAPPVWLARLYIAVWSKAASAPGRRRRRPVLRVSRRLRRPAVWGVWRPVVVLPKKICCPEQAALLHSVLRHELAHVRHGDAWLRLLANVALPLLCLHPLYWWICRCMRLDSELLADDAAAREQGLFLYASQMIELARRCRAAASPWPAAAEMLGTRTQFYRRMKMLLQRTQPLTLRPTGRWWMLALLGMLAVVVPTIVCVGIRPVAAQAAEEDEYRYTRRQELLRRAQHAIAELEAQGRDVPEDLRKLAGRLTEPVAAAELDEAAAALKSLLRKLKEFGGQDADKLDAVRQKLLRRAREAIQHFESQGKEVPGALRELAARLVEPATAEELQDAAALLKALLAGENVAPQEKRSPDARRREKLRDQAVARLKKLFDQLGRRGIEVPADAAEVLDRLQIADGAAAVDELLEQAASTAEKLQTLADATGGQKKKSPASSEVRDKLAAAWKSLHARLETLHDRLAQQQDKQAPDLAELTEELIRIQQAHEQLLKDADAKIEALAGKLQKLLGAGAEQPVPGEDDSLDPGDRMAKQEHEEHLEPPTKKAVGVLKKASKKAKGMLKEASGKKGEAAFDVEIETLDGLASLNDLLSLGERYIEAQGHVDWLRKHFEWVETLPPEERQGMHDPSMKHELSIAERRAKLLRAALESLRSASEKMVEAARGRRDALRKAYGSGLVSGVEAAAGETELIRAETTLQVITAILEQ